MPGSHIPFIHLTRSKGRTQLKGDKHFARTQGYEGGLYAQWSYDSGLLTAETDPLGFYPLFYAVRDTCLTLSPSLKKVAALTGETLLDEEAIASLIHYGQVLGDTTLYKAIKMMPPNAVLSWENGRFSLSGDYRFPKPQTLKREAAIDAYITLFQKAISKAVKSAKGRITVPLTGGRDSRHILFELHRQKAPIDCAITAHHFPIRSDEDMAIAKRLCDALQVTHKALPTHGHYPEAEAQKLPALEWLSLEHIFSLPVLKYLEKHHDHSVFDGLGGDVLSAGLYLNQNRHRQFEAGRYDTLARDFCRTSGFETLLSAQARQKFGIERALPAIAKELQKHSNAANPISSFLFWNRTRRNVALAPFQLMSARALDVATPFIDLPLFDFLSSLPPEMMWDHSFHDEAIARAYPQWAHLPYEKKTVSFKTPPSLTRACASYAFRHRWMTQKGLYNHKMHAALIKAFLFPRISEPWWFRRGLYISTLLQFLKGAV